MSRNEKDQAVSDLLTLDDFKTWSSVALKTTLIVDKLINKWSVDVLAARYFPFLNYVQAKFHLNEHCCSTCTCLDFARLVVVSRGRYLGPYFSKGSYLSSHPPAHPVESFKPY